MCNAKKLLKILITFAYFIFFIGTSSVYAEEQTTLNDFSESQKKNSAEKKGTDKLDSENKNSEHETVKSTSNSSNGKSSEQETVESASNSSKKESTTTPELKKNEISTQLATALIDRDGSITGKKGATYYNVSTWNDMFDSYKNATVNPSSNNTVYLNLVSDIPGSTREVQGQKIIAGKSVNIIGNDHTIYVDNDTNYSTSIGGTYTNSGFSATASDIGFDTKMTVQNAKILNNMNGGIFQVTGSAKATTIYNNVTVSNGAPTNGAKPIRNDAGKILFQGNNDFKILQNHDFNDASLAGVDNQGEWIQGGYWVEVVDGTTNLEQNWWYDQPFYTYRNTGATLKVDDGAKLNWNLNQTYTMYYDDYNSGEVTWDIGENSEFNINGTDKTASRNSNWFMWTQFTKWTLNVAESGKLNVATGGGSINLDAFKNGVRFNFGKNSEIIFNNLGNTGNLFSGLARSGSQMVLNDVDELLLKSKNNPVFNTNTKLPIVINGSGLRLHASKDYNTDGTNMSDLWKRITTGTILSDFSETTDLTPTQYSPSDFNFLKSSKYINFYKPKGLKINSVSTDKSFNVDLSKLPEDGSWSDFISSNEDTALNLFDDRGLAPNYTLQLTQTSNKTPRSTKYYWKNINDSSPKLLSDEATNLFSVTSDSNIPYSGTMAKAGNQYQFDFDKANGLMLKAKNNLKLQNGSNAVFTYNIISGIN